MKPRRYQYHKCLIVIACIAFIFTMVIRANLVEGEQSNISGGESRSDVITIDSLKSFGALERKTVPFLHDAHTAALEKNNKSCNTCHLTGDVSGKTGLSLKFKRTEDKSRQEVMDIYHTNCIACHKEMSISGNKTGPIEVCGECHKIDTGIISSGIPIGFDLSLHYRHEQAQKDDCGRCHHEYNEKEKKLFYAKDKEGSCRYCHQHETKNNIISMRLASHTGCIDCHSKSLAKKMKSGPITCSGCHDPHVQNKIEKISSVPRMKRNQPDYVLLKSTRGGDEVKTGKQASMNPVPFDHKAHEGRQGTCRVCHHAEISSCSQTCHTITGDKKGAMINAEKAMHQPDNEKSCLGCHDINKGRKECAGCHGLMTKERSSENACLRCHTEIPKSEGAENQKPELIASMLLKSKKTASGSIEDKDIPETVTINNLSDKYGAVELPHRRIFESLMNNTNNNNLAKYFHNGKETLCLGCHHNSPASKTPPNCINCHSNSFDAPASSKTDLKVAYHQQCMGCHDRMVVGKPKSTDCEGCHKAIGVKNYKGF
jgi:hypothetical protein